MIKRLAKGIAYSPRTVRFVERLEARLPFLRQWHRMQYQRHFDRVYQYERIFNGVYPDYASALAHIPKDRPVGYDNAGAATFLGRTSAMLPSEYPVLFWLAQVLPDNPAVFDFGGYLGLNYNWCRRYNIHPPNLRWTIYDVPAVIREGQQILEREPDPRLQFTTDLTQAASANILLASGSLQFCEESLAEMLEPLASRPANLLINKTPITERETYFTLNNMGPAISVYKISNRTGFIASLGELGYELVDAWKNPDLTCYIPLHPDHTVSAFDGYYFRRTNSPSTE
jgi:putative methyltransferase (TIGR04325 family)